MPSPNTPGSAAQTSYTLVYNAKRHGVDGLVGFLDLATNHLKNTYIIQAAGIFIGEGVVVSLYAAQHTGRLGQLAVTAITLEFVTESVEPIIEFTRTTELEPRHILLRKAGELISALSLDSVKRLAGQKA